MTDTTRNSRRPPGVVMASPPPARSRGGTAGLGPPGQAAVRPGRCRFRRILLLGLLLAAAGLRSTPGGVASLLPAADTALRSTSPDNNFGASTNLPVGVSGLGSPVNRALFRFSLAGIPTNATITSATLRLVVVQALRPAADYELHRMLSDWGEGQGTGTPTSPGDATWNANFNGTSTWAAGGGAAGTDYVLTASATNTLGAVGSTNDFASATMTADVQSWLTTPGSNFGWILLAAGEPAGTGKQVGSRENPGNEPVLEVEYTVPGPVGPTLFGVTLSGDTIQFQFHAEPNVACTVESRCMEPRTDWIVLTNIPALATPATLTVSDVLTPSNRCYRVRTP